MTQSSGRYAVHAEIGSGGMATVHLGRLVGARGFARTVAIKVLHASYAKNADFVERFLDEARIVGRIHHPNVMPTLDVIADGDDLRIVMDYVAGESLDQLQAKMREKGERIPASVASAIITSVLHGLHAAHEAKNEFGEPLGIVHLDVSPHNILVGVDGTTRVLDFGVARARGMVQSADTGVTGKSAYLAPEQVRGVDVSPRTDVFSASIVLWEMLTGEPLFAADNHAATMQRVLGGVIPPASDKVPELPQRLDEVLLTGLRRDPAQRFATARDMALALERAIVPALGSEVGTWVESVAQETLLARAALVQEMESQSMSLARPSGQLAGLVAAREMYAEQAAINLPSEDLEDDVSSLMRPPGGRGAIPQRAKDGSIRWKPATVPPPKTTPSRPPTAVVGLANPPRLPEKKAAKVDPRRRMVLGIVAAVVVVALALFAIGARSLFLPGHVRAAAIEAAASHGVTLTVNEALLGDDGVTLRGLTARLVGVPQLSATIASAEVKSIWSSPARISLGKTEVVIDGDLNAIASALTGWSRAHRGKTKVGDESVGGQIDVPSAHLVWTHVSGPGGADVTRIEANALTGSIGSSTSASLGDELHLLSSALVIETKLGNFGPWYFTLDSTIKGARGRLAFDPAVPDGANALLIDDALGDSSFDVTIPRLNAAGLGIPRTAFGPDVPFPQQLELAVHYASLNHEQTTATLRAALYGLRIAELGNSVDAHVSGETAGPTGSTLTVKKGLFTLGSMRATVTGTIAPHPEPGPGGESGVKTSLAWKADAIACADLVALPSAGSAARDLTKKATAGDLGDLGQLARDFGAIGEAIGAVKVTGSFAASGTFVADSADLSHAKWTIVAKNACGLALFQGK